MRESLEGQHLMKGVRKKGDQVVKRKVWSSDTYDRDECGAVGGET